VYAGETKPGPVVPDRKAMLKAKKILERIRNDHGASAVEYGLMVSLIAAAIVTLVSVLGSRVGFAFQAIVNALPN
jgi:pilus assembly protein Flp/PilA